MNAYIIGNAKQLKVIKIDKIFYKMETKINSYN